jgi:hypothetical protein
VEFFGNSGLGVPRGKPASSRSNGSNVKEMVRAKQPFHREREILLSSPSTKLRIEDVCSTDPEIGYPPLSTGDGEDGGEVAGSDIDGETVTDSDADASIVLVHSQSVRKQPTKNTKYSNPEPEAAATIPRGSQPAQNRVDEVRLTGSRASRFRRESGTIDKGPPPSMKLRSLPKRTYKASVDLNFEDEDSEPALRERERKKPRHNYESLPADTLLGKHTPGRDPETLLLLIQLTRRQRQSSLLSGSLPPPVEASCLLCKVSALSLRRHGLAA